MPHESPLYIPRGLKTRPEIFSGFGKAELYQTIFTSLAAGAVSLIIFSLTHNISTLVITMLASIAGSVMIFTKDSTNQSVADHLGNMLRFAKSQKLYRYKYLDEWGD